VAQPPLAHYREHPGVGVLLICTKCAKSRRLELEKVIDRLRARGLGDERTGIRAVAAFVEEPCECGKRSWETRPDFPAGRPGYAGPPTTRSRPR